MKRVRQHIPCYVNGYPFRGVYSRYSGLDRPRDCRADQVIALISPQLDWGRLWEIVVRELQRHGYGRQTQKVYRVALRRFARFARSGPARATARQIRAYLHHLNAGRCSWNWLGTNLAVLRTVLDKLGGLSVTEGLRTPRRPFRLPVILSPGEARQILAAATTTRDQLLLGLLYGCGLKVGEVCALRWRDVDVDRDRLRIRFARGTRERSVEIPPELRPVLSEGVRRCAPPTPVFQGRHTDRPLSSRMVERIVRRAWRAAGIVKPVTAMTLRHSFAVHYLEAGETVRAVQEALGHESVETTLLYRLCTTPREAVSPLERLPAPPAADLEPKAAGVTVPVREPLFAEPVSVAAVELPFREERERSAADFWRTLKTQLFGRFLTTRQATGPPAAAG